MKFQQKYKHLKYKTYVLNKNIGIYEFHIQERSTSDYRAVIYNHLRSDGYRYLAQFDTFAEASDYLYGLYNRYYKWYRIFSKQKLSRLPFFERLSIYWDNFIEYKFVELILDGIIYISRCFGTALLFPVIYIAKCLIGLPAALKEFFSETHFTAWDSLTDILTFKSFRHASKLTIYPEQEWVRKQLCNTWQDKPELIQHILFEGIVHFVECEGGLGPQYYKGKKKQRFDKFWMVRAYKTEGCKPSSIHEEQTLADDIIAYDLITDAYLYITKHREDILTAMQYIEMRNLTKSDIKISCLTRIEDYPETEKRAGHEYIGLTQKLYTEDQRVLGNIIKVLPYLWT